MATKQKCVTHLQPGDVVCWDGMEDERHRWPVGKLEPHTEYPDAVSVSFTYVDHEPDGEGGTRPVTKMTGGIMYQRNENVKILVKQ